jgi:phosphatidylserine/phosphatidylglycerophosphate/cardiolipin synthase-like enzyme
VRTQLPPPPPRPPPGKPGTLKVQVVRTFGDGLKHSGLADLDIPTVLTAGTLTPIQEPVVGLLQQAPSTYAFASGGERGIFNLIVNSISAAQRFIYLEDQYLISEQPVAGGNSIAQRLAAKLTSADFQTLVILAARTESVNGELFQAWARRRAFVQQLKAAAPAKVAVCQYKVIPGQAVDTNVPTYVHSKTWIFDDEFCIVSSANCNRRGYTHDSEVGAGVFDPNNDGNRLYFAHALRMRLWMKHLNPSGDPSITERDLLDPVAASRFWRTPLPISAIEAYDEFGDTRSPPAAPNVNADRLLPLPLKSLTSQVLKNAQDEWDTLIDPDGA